jgi:hypothetical protein
VNVNHQNPYLSAVLKPMSVPTCGTHGEVVDAVAAAEHFLELDRADVSRMISAVAIVTIAR